MAEWGFYGRRQPAAELARLLQLKGSESERPAPLAVGLSGRLGVGKTTLLQHVLQRHGAADRMLYVWVPSSEYQTDACYWKLLKAIKEALQRTDRAALLDDMKPERGLADAQAPDECSTVIRHLLDKGVIIALDQAHHMLNTGLPAMLESIIQEQRDRSVGERMPGRLVLLSSHQQQFPRLQEWRQPLQALVPGLELGPWSLATVMEVARDQGWDRRPDRLLTLWTAHGGLPGGWRRWAQDDALPDQLRQGWDQDADDSAGDRSWHAAFVSHERQHLLNGNHWQSWNNHPCIELSLQLRAALVWLGTRPDPARPVSTAELATAITYGYPADLTPAQIQKEVDLLAPELQALARATGMVEACSCGGDDADPTESWWRLQDGTALLQLALDPDRDERRRYGRRRDYPEGEILKRCGRTLRMLESVALDRLVAGWLQDHPHAARDDVCWAPPLAPGRDGSLDHVAALARLRPPPVRKLGRPDLLVMAAAHRTGRRHDEAAFRRTVQSFLAADRRPFRYLQALPLALLFVAPTFAPDDRERLRAAGHMALNLQDMANEMRAGWPLLQERLEQARQAEPS